MVYANGKLGLLQEKCTCTGKSRGEDNGCGIPCGSYKWYCNVSTGKCDQGPWGTETLSDCRAKGCDKLPLDKRYKCDSSTWTCSQDNTGTMSLDDCHSGCIKSGAKGKSLALILGIVGGVIGLAIIIFILIKVLRKKGKSNSNSKR